MSITYFMCPLSIATLGAAFKISANYNSISQIEDLRQNHLVDGWFKFISSIAAFIFVFMLFMYMTKVLLFPNKVRKEKQDPHYGPYFSTITISFMIFGILCYDLIPSQGDNSPGKGVRCIDLLLRIAENSLLVLASTTSRGVGPCVLLVWFGGSRSSHYWGNV